MKNLSSAALAAAVWLCAGVSWAAEAADQPADAATEEPASAIARSGGDWTRGFGTRTHDLAFGLAAEDDGALYFGAIYRGRFALSQFDLDGAFEPVGANDSAVIAVDADGTGRWAKALGGDGVTEIRTLATDDDGVVATGYFLGNFKVEGLAPLSSHGGADGFVAAFGRDGTPRWTKHFGGKGADLAVAAAGLAGEGIVLVGQFESAARFGENGDGTPRVLQSAGAKDLYIARLDAKGRVVDAQHFGGAGDERAIDVARTADGGFVVLAMHAGAFDACGTNVATHGDSDGLLLRFDADGKCTAARSIGRAGSESWDALAIADDGATWIGGLLVGKADIAFGDERRALSSAGSSDVVLARLDEAFAPTHAFTIGNEGADMLHAIEAGSGGHVLVAASGTGALTIGKFQRTAAVPHAYVVRVSPGGDATALANVSARGITQPTGLAALRGDRFAMVGLFEDAIEHPGEAPAPAFGRTDAFITVRRLR